MITYVVRKHDPHYVDHLAPIWEQTGGQFYVHPSMLEHAERKGVAAEAPEGRDWLLRSYPGPIVVAGYGDYADLRHINRPIALVNHGNGQSFPNHQSYSGGSGREGVDLFIEPNEYAAGKTRDVLPYANVAVTGSPRVDYLRRLPKPDNEKPVIAVSFHWDCAAFPETRSAWRHYRKAVRDLAEYYTVIGHGHPRIIKQLQRTYERFGIETVHTFEEVLKRADVYANDASSTLYEFAATGRPVVVLNAPWYRRDVEHGLRFWEYADVGLQANNRAGLIPAVEETLANDPQRKRREQITRAVYPYAGQAAKRAAKAIKELGTEVAVRVTVEQAKRLPDGRTRIKGTVQGAPRIVVADVGREPSREDLERALQETPLREPEVRPRRR